MDEKGTLLIVDDEPLARETAQSLLWKEGYELQFAANGLEAIRAVRDHEVDVILSDVMMPDMNGFELCEHLKDHSRYKHIPIILITALDSRENLLHGFTAGADDFVSKPVRGTELRARVRSMMRIKHQYDELQNALRLREDLSEMIVHDLKNPLAGILFSAGVLNRADDVNERAQSHVGKIQKQANRLNAMIDELLMTAKMRSGKLLLGLSDFEACAFVKEVAANQAIIAETRDVRIDVDVPADRKLPLQADRNLLSRTIENLIANAIKYSDRNSRVILRVLQTEVCESLPAGIAFEVVDEGIGIPAEHHRRIFEKFEVGPDNGNDTPNFGIGLAFCKLVVDAHGGLIEVRNNEGPGTTFSIRF